MVTPALADRETPLSRVLIVGLGSIGRRHLTNIRTLVPGVTITVWHHRQREQVESVESAVRHVYGFEDAVDPPPEVAIIASPAPMHIPAALALAARGVHLFIEKPLSHTLEGVEDLINLCEQRGLVLSVGYNFRYYEPLRILRSAIHDGCVGRLVSIRAEVGQHLADWRPDNNPHSVIGRADLGGDVLLELSHELDYLRWIGGEVESVMAETGTLSGLEIHVQDTAEIILRFRNGAIGSAHLDMIQRPPTRTCRAVGTNGTVTWDWSDHRVRLFTPDRGGEIDLHPACAIDRNEMYISELRDFLECMVDNRTPLVSAEDGRRALALALAAKASALSRQAEVPS